MNNVECDRGQLELATWQVGLLTSNFETLRNSSFFFCIPKLPTNHHTHNSVAAIGNVLNVIDVIIRIATKEAKNKKWVELPSIQYDFIKYVHIMQKVGYF